MSRVGRSGMAVEMLALTVFLLVAIAVAARVQAGGEAAVVRDVAALLP